MALVIACVLLVTGYSVSNTHFSGNRRLCLAIILRANKVLIGTTSFVGFTQPAMTSPIGESSASPCRQVTPVGTFFHLAFFWERPMNATANRLQF